MSHNNDFENRPFDKEAFWHRVAGASGVDSVDNSRTERRKSYIPRIAGIAAVLAIGVFGVKYLPFHSVSHIPSPVSQKTYATTAGQRATILLSDGTRVTLAPLTSIRYGSDYGAERRDVHLEGEAYFDAATQPNKPMVIFAGSTTTQVLGTSFSVRKYSNDKSVRVAVMSGKVAFTGAGVLKRGDLAEFDAAGATKVQRNVDVDAIASWRNGRLAFNNVIVRDVLPDLERWYGLKLQLASPGLANRHITAAFERETQSEMISALSTLLGAKVARSGDVVTFTAIER